MSAVPIVLELLGAIEASSAAAAVRTSIWIYPFVNTVHVLGIGLLFGAVVAVDLRLLGLARTLPLGPLFGLLLPCAWLGFALALVSGGALFIAEATGYARHPLFLAKLVAIGFAGANMLWLHAGRRVDGGERPRGAAVAALASIAIWLTVITLGRLIAYF